MTQTYHYPLSENSPESIYAKSGRQFQDVNLQNLISDQLTPDDLRIQADTLLTQAEFAATVGFDRFADNLRRAAELTHVPSGLLLKFYEALRPYRSTESELNDLADKLNSEFDAKRCAEFIREAAKVYKARELLRRS